jgi:hypothetical protein
MENGVRGCRHFLCQVGGPGYADRVVPFPPPTLLPEVPMPPLARTLAAAVGGAALAWCAATVVAQPRLPAAQPLTPLPGQTWGDNDYTAFPELAPAPGPDPKRGIPGLDRLAAAAKEVPKDATPLRKVQIAQLRAGYSYIVRVWIRIQIGSYRSEEFHQTLRQVVATYRVAADMTDDPAEKVRWREDEVRVLHEMERFVAHRVPNVDPPHALDQARFERLAGEADLLRAKAAAPRH